MYIKVWIYYLEYNIHTNYKLDVLSLLNASIENSFDSCYLVGLVFLKIVACDLIFSFSFGIFQKNKWWMNFDKLSKYMVTYWKGNPSLMDSFDTPFLSTSISSNFFLCYLFEFEPKCPLRCPYFQSICCWIFLVKPSHNSITLSKSHICNLFIFSLLLTKITQAL